jgi:hypothetical protein
MKKTFLTSLLILSLVFLTGCEDKTDTDTVVDFIYSWMVDKGLMTYDPATDTYTPTIKMAGVATGFMGSGDDRIDAAVQAGAVVQSIKDSDELVDQAQQDMEKTPPDTKAAISKVDQAIENRPDDWYYRETRALIHLQSGSTTSASTDFSASERLCASGSLCFRNLQQQRVRSLENLMQGNPAYQSNCEVLRQLYSSHQYLAHLSDDSYQHFSSGARVPQISGLMTTSGCPGR